MSLYSDEIGGWANDTERCSSCGKLYEGPGCPSCATVLSADFRTGKVEVFPVGKFVPEGKPGERCPDCEGAGWFATAWRDGETMRPETCLNCLGRGIV